jgi:hypothetical protein
MENFGGVLVPIVAIVGGLVYAGYVKYLAAQVAIAEAKAGVLDVDDPAEVNRRILAALTRLDERLDKSESAV